MRNYDVILIIIALVLSILLYLAAGYAEKVLSPGWRMLYAIPFVVVLAFAGLYEADLCMVGVYVGSVLLLAGFLWEKKKIRRIAAILAAVLSISAIPVCSLSPVYRAPNYLEDFEEGFAMLREFYVLEEHKGIDWTQLYEKYEPRFREVQKEHDAVGNYMAWYEFCSEFHDGHVYYAGNKEEVVNKAEERMYGNDYGLALMTLENGQSVAVNVEPGSAPALAGIRNGTVITAWNGQDIEELKARVRWNWDSFPDRENERFYSALPVAGFGEDEVEITFLDDNGEQHMVTAPKLGAYAKRMKDTLEILHRSPEAGHLSWITLDEHTACLKLKMMMYDANSYESGNHSQMQQELKEKLLSLKESGTDKLVIDLRNNTGGSPIFDMAIASLLAPEGEHTFSYDGVWDQEKRSFRKESDGRYQVGGKLSYFGENIWDGQVIVLVNASTVSAGDALVLMLSELDNVTIMGFTRSNSSCQAVCGVEFEHGSLSFSAVPNLTEEGLPIIDTDASGESTMPLDVKVSFDEEAVAALFDRGEDYLLKLAIEYGKTGENKN
ncbi:MAG: S41 family peptidase [Acetatifactor sp.]